MKRIFPLFVIAVLSLLNTIESHVDAAEAVVDKPELIARAQEVLESSDIFKKCEPRIQTAWLSIARIVLRYQSMTIDELRSMSDLKIKEERTRGRFLQVVATDSNKGEFEFNFDEVSEYMSGVKITDTAGGAIGARFNKRLADNVTEVKSGFVSKAEHSQIYQFEFRSGLALPALVFCSQTDDSSKHQGAVLLWNESGALLTEHVVELSGQAATWDLERRTAIEAAHIKAGIASPTSRLRSSPAFSTAEISMQRSMQDALAWGEDLVHTGPDELSKRLGGTELVIQEQEGERLYVVKTSRKVLWTVGYDKLTSQLKYAIYNDGGMSLQFGNDGKTELLGGMVRVREFGKEDFYWLLGFYPGTCTPRLAISAVGTAVSGPDSSGSRCSWVPPDNFQVKGRIQIWDPKGAPVVKKEVESTTDLDQVLADIEMSLNESQRIDIGWLGQSEERKILVGKD